MSAGNAGNELSGSSEDQAAEWIARRSTGFSVKDEEAFEAWLLADPQNSRAFTELKAAWDIVSLHSEPRLAAAALDQLKTQEHVAHGRRRFALIGISSLAAAAAVVFAFLPGHQPAAKTLTVSETFEVRPNRQILPDGTVVELNSGAKIVVSFTPERRNVELKQGEALFEVTKNPARPFVVLANHVEVTAIGTAFVVTNLQEKIGVLVTEGRVKVEPAPNQVQPELIAIAKPLLVGAGYKVEVPVSEHSDSAISAEKVSESQLDRALAWRSNRVEFTRTPLAEAVRLFNRRNNVQLMIADEYVQNLNVSGFFWLDDPEGFVRLLQAGFDLKTEHIDQHVLLRAP